MPPRKRSRAHVPRRSSRAVAAPENVPLVEYAQPKRVFHFEHIFATASAFVFVFSLLLTLSSPGRAQEFRAPVNATVLPLDSYSNYRLNQLHPLVRWWESLDAYHRLMYGSAAGLSGLVIPLGALLAAQQYRHHKRAGAHTPQAPLTSA